MTNRERGTWIARFKLDRSRGLGSEMRSEISAKFELKFWNTARIKSSWFENFYKNPIQRAWWDQSKRESNTFSLSIRPSECEPLRVSFQNLNTFTFKCPTRPLDSTRLCTWSTWKRIKFNARCRCRAAPALREIGSRSRRRVAKRRFIFFLFLLFAFPYVYLVPGIYTILFYSRAPAKRVSPGAFSYKKNIFFHFIWLVLFFYYCFSFLCVYKNVPGPAAGC